MLQRFLEACWLSYILGVHSGYSWAQAVDLATLVHLWMMLRMSKHPFLLSSIDVFCELRARSLPFPLSHQRFVVGFLPTYLLFLNLIVLPLESAAFFLCRHCFFNEILRAIFAVNASRIKFGWPFDDRASLRELRHLGLRGGFLVVPVRIEHGPQ